MFSITRSERRQFKKRKKLKPSEWARKYRRVTYGQLKGSLWSDDFMPHMKDMIDAFFYPSVRELGNCKAPQTGSSSGAETGIAYAAERAPGDTLIVYPNEVTTRERSKDYLQPIFKDSPKLRELLTGDPDDMSSGRIGLRTQTIFMGWAGSATSLGNKSIKYLYCDEVDKWPDRASKKEAGPILLAKERVRSYKYTHKISYVSTPTITSGPIWVYITKEASVVFDYHAKCPYCGTHQAMKMDRIRYSEWSKNPVEILEKKLARYECEKCGELWEDIHRDKAVRSGVWRARNDGRDLWSYLKQENPSKIGFHSPSWISQLVSLSEVAAAYVKAQKSIDGMRYYKNQHAAEAFEPHHIQRQQDAILALAEDRPAGVVPKGGEVSVLLASADTQDNGFFFEIRAFGWGMALDSWQIRHGFVTDLAELHHVVFETPYSDVDGKQYQTRVLIIDSQGHRTKEVYDYARKNPMRVKAYNGAPGRRARPITTVVKDFYPPPYDKIAVPGGLKIFTCDTHYFKDLLHDRLRVLKGDPGAWLMHSGISEDYANQICAEYRDERLLWQCPKGKDNHYWDCAVMLMALAELLQVKFLQKRG